MAGGYAALDESDARAKLGRPDNFNALYITNFSPHYDGLDGPERELAPLVAQHGAPLLDIPGCGVVTAARLLAEIGHIDRFRTDAQLAIYAGAAPLDASSGKQRRHRLNRAGNRQLNSALHVIALTQARIHPGAREFIARHRAAGKNSAEALRALKRHLARRIFRLFKAMQTAAAAAAPVPIGAPTPIN